MKIGQCKLCGQQRELINSHIWSAFGYKYYAADRAKGGRFADLGLKETHNKQYKRQWMCWECDGIRLGEAESYVAELVRRIEKNPDAVHDYDDRLLRFATSISWRTALYDLELEPSLANSHIQDALKRWRQFLLNKKDRLRPFSQHVFVVFDNEFGLHKGVGGNIYPRDGFVVSHIGPLFMVGLFERTGRSLSELRVWEKSELRSDGSLTAANMSDMVPGQVPPSLASRMQERLQAGVDVAIEMHAKGVVPR